MMGLFEHWPYVNFHELNLDWIIKEIPKVFASRDEAQASAEAAAENAEASQLSAAAAQLSKEAANDSAESAAAYAETIEQKAEQIDLNTQRIDNLLVEGTPTEGNAELIDIRVGANGVTYQTAGDAVRGQFDELKTSVLSETRNQWINPVYNANGVVLTQNADGSVHVSGTPSQNLYINKILDQPLSTENYVLSCNIEGTMSGAKKLFLDSRNQENTGTVFIQFDNSATTFKKVNLYNFAPYKYEIILFSDTTYNCDLYIQLETGVNVTDYIPHVTAVDHIARENINNNIENMNVLTLPVKNYETVMQVNDRSVITKWGSSQGVITVENNTIRYTLSTTESGGFQTETFSASDIPSTYVRVSLDATPTLGNIRVWLGGSLKNGGGISFIAQKDITASGHYDVDIDLAYIDVYTTLSITDPLFIMITTINNATGADFTIENLIVKSNLIINQYVRNYENTDAITVLQRISIGNTESINNAEKYYFSPDGTKYMFTVNNDGTSKGIKAIPNKSVFIGNSLLMGWSTFGMAATDNMHDYYHYVTEKISDLDQTATFNRVSNGNLEHATNNQDFNAAWNVITPYLTPDLDLICIQLGDNVNTEAKRTQFEGTSFNTMIDWIRENCQNARIVWVGTWYQSIHDWLKIACWQKGVQFIDILDLATDENKSQLGTVIARTENRTQTLSGSYTVSGSQLLLDAIIYGAHYSITIPSYSTVENNGDNTFTMTAPYTVVDSTGIASHPGDSGMLAIANRICKNLDYIYSEGDIV